MKTPRYFCMRCRHKISFGVLCSACIDQLSDDADLFEEKLDKAESIDKAAGWTDETIKKFAKVS